MTSAERSPRVRLDVTVPAGLAASLHDYARRWEVSLSSLVEIACARLLDDAHARVDSRPVRLRLRHRRGPLSSLEQSLSEDVLRIQRARGGRPVRR